MQEPMRTMLKQFISITDEDLDRLSPGIQKLVAAGADLAAYRIIAEVTDAKYCSSGCKPGDKLVIGPGSTLNVEESTCPPCLGALGPLMQRVYMIWDRLAEGVDPNGLWITGMQCFDPGIEHGGLGSVHFKIYAEKRG
ncbi:MAG: hypothetical protein ACUVV3_10235 [Dehalococcoidia bacterium]